MTDERRGRPRQFVEGAVLDRAVDVFWAHGFAGATTRVLEAQLEMRQSSIYNAFGSKEALLHRSVDHYLDRVDTMLLAPLAAEEAGPGDLQTFLDELLVWISDPAHPGCLMLNLTTEQRQNDQIAEQAKAYRSRLRSLFRNALGENASAASAEVLLSGVLGLNQAAGARADAAELEAMTSALKQFVSTHA